MARLNQELLGKIASRLGIDRRSVYGRLAKIERERGLDLESAALFLAQSLNIGIKKFSSAQKRVEIARAATGSSSGSGRTLEQSANDRPRTASRSIRKPARPKTKENTVFVVHGRDTALRDSMYTFLAALGLQHREWAHALRAARAGNPYVGDAVQKIMEEATAIVVLFSPDDEVRLKSHFVRPGERRSEGQLQGQARPNVLFEAGIALGAHSRKTILVEVGRVKSFSDIGGMHMCRLSNDRTRRNDLANRLETIGCKIDRSGDLWTNAGHFVPSAENLAPRRARASRKS